MPGTDYKTSRRLADHREARRQWLETMPVEDFLPLAEELRFRSDELDCVCARLAKIGLEDPRAEDLRVRLRDPAEYRKIRNEKESRIHLGYVGHGLRSFDAGNSESLKKAGRRVARREKIASDKSARAGRGTWKGKK